MTRKKAETVTGCQIAVVYGDGTYFVEAVKDGIPIALSSDRIEKRALADLVHKVYKINSDKAMNRSDWKCERCGQIGPLQAHHIQHRSHGRIDDPDNLEILCESCHRQCHGG